MKGGPKTFKQWASLNLDQSAFEHLVNVVEYDGSQVDFVARADGVWDLGNEFQLFSPFERAVSWVKNRKISRCLRSARGIIYQSEFSKDSCEKKWPDLKNKPNIIIPNPLASHRFGAVKWVGNECTKKLKIVMFHRHTPMKASYLGADFAKCLSETLGIEVELYIIGTIPRYIRHWYYSLERLSWVRVIEHNASNEFIDYVVNCDFVLNLAHFDPCPNVVLECVTIGVPIVAITSGGVPELLGGDYPYLLQPFFEKKSWILKNRPTSFALNEFNGKVSGLISKTFDPALYHFPRSNCNEKSVADRYEEFILSFF